MKSRNLNVYNDDNNSNGNDNNNNTTITNIQNEKWVHDDYHCFEHLFFHVCMHMVPFVLYLASDIDYVIF